MLDILQQMRPELPLYAVNVNFLPQLVQAWEITSVPCLMKLHDGQSDDRLYAMQSIDNLYRFLVQEQTKQ
jgi:thioredoxin-like negative regulator of GroEL